ncbi:hypothetical protein ElyMa_006704100 [Elysia marginata]|uniref:Uncharacterized protein n=1 Tax=Elysia marginata TaxID=1093978 RepID=A0AAV4ITI5_9GAST|nr:hypothetical protein ElyMa_006704100 [Elysia marginata]
MPQSARGGEAFLVSLPRGAPVQAPAMRTNSAALFCLTPPDAPLTGGQLIEFYGVFTAWTVRGLKFKLTAEAYRSLANCARVDLCHAQEASSVTSSCLQWNVHKTNTWGQKNLLTLNKG